MTVEKLRVAIAKLRELSIEPGYPSGHARCCKGFRVAGKHSPYCFTTKGFYVLPRQPVEGPQAVKFTDPAKGNREDTR